MLRVLIAILLTAFLAATPVIAQDHVTAFVNVSVVPMDRERVLTDQTVLVRGARIVKVGPADRVRVPTEAVQVDGKGKFLIPGLGDMHVHLRHHKGGGSPFEPMLLLYLANGVTTVRDMHSEGGKSPLFALRQQVAAGQLLGPRIYTAGDFKGRREGVAELKAAGHDFVKYYAKPDDPQFDTIMAAAARVNLPVAGHVPDSIGLDGVLKARWASIEHLTGYFEYLTGVEFTAARYEDRIAGIRRGDSVLPPMSDTLPSGQPWWTKPKYRVDPVKLRKIAEATRQAGTWNTPTLLLYTAFPLILDKNYQRADPAWLEKAKVGIYPLFQIVKALRDAGAGLLLGTDARLPGFTTRRELEALVLAGLTPYQALETGTRNIAAFLGILDSAGTIAPGKRADLVLLYGNPLQDISYTAGPAGVMVSGQWLPRAELDARLDAIHPYVDQGSSTYNLRSWDLKEVRRLEWPVRHTTAPGSP